MATIQFKKGDEYLLKISKLEAEMKDQVIGSAIYGAADIVADEIRTSLEQVPTDERFGTKSSPTIGPKQFQKEGLMRSLGIASMQDQLSDAGNPNRYDTYTQEKYQNVVKAMEEVLNEK